MLDPNDYILGVSDYTIEEPERLKFIQEIRLNDTIHKHKFHLLGTGRLNPTRIYATQPWIHGISTGITYKCAVEGIVYPAAPKGSKSLTSRVAISNSSMRDNVLAFNRLYGIQ